MKQLKSKKTGHTQIISDDDYANVVRRGTIPMTRFEVTEIKSMRPIIPSLKEKPVEIKSPVEIKKIIKKQKNEG